MTSLTISVCRISGANVTIAGRWNLHASRLTSRQYKLRRRRSDRPQLCDRQSNTDDNIRSTGDNHVRNHPDFHCRDVQLRSRSHAHVDYGHNLQHHWKYPQDRRGGHLCRTRNPGRQRQLQFSAAGGSHAQDRQGPANDHLWRTPSANVRRQALQRCRKRVVQAGDRIYVDHPCYMQYQFQHSDACGGWHVLAARLAGRRCQLFGSAHGHPVVRRGQGPAVHRLRSSRHAYRWRCAFCACRERIVGACCRFHLRPLWECARSLPACWRFLRQAPVRSRRHRPATATFCLPPT